jgi:hypothetical protein
MKSAQQMLLILMAILLTVSCGLKNQNITEVKLIPIKNGKEFQFIDKEGKIIINPQFSDASIFRNGLALVKTTGEDPKYGFIAEDGKFIINANYKSATIFNENLAWVVTENNAPCAINQKGEIIITLQDAETVNIFKEGLALFSIMDSSGEKFGFIDNAGKTSINPQFDGAGNFSNGFCAVENKDNKWGFINHKGEVVINYQFDEAEIFINGKAIVTSGNKKGLIDSEGKYVINPQYSKIIQDDDKLLIKLESKWGWADLDGKIIINPQFTEAYPFNKQRLAAVKIGNTWGYIDLEGKTVINPQFEIALPFNGELAAVELNNKIGFINMDGKYTINPQYDEITKDYYFNLFNGKSNFETVVTDYFNINSIVSRIILNNPEGLNFSNTLLEIKEILAVTDDKFNLYNKEQLLIKNQKITSDATFDFYVVANASKNVSNGYYYTSKVLDLDNKVESFVYAISLTNKGYEKEKKVKEAFEASLTNYKKDDAKSTPDLNYYSNEKQIIKTYMYNSSIIIFIQEKIEANSQ